MRIELGDLELIIDVLKQGRSAPSLALQAAEAAMAALISSPKSEAEAPPAPSPEETESPEPTPQYGGEDLGLLHELGFTDHTVTMVLRKVVGCRIPTGQLKFLFNECRPQVLTWTKAPITAPYWGLYIAPIDVKALGSVFVAVGLNADNCLTFLGLEKSIPCLYKGLLDRGLKPKAVKFGMLSIYADTDATFRKVFPSAELARDWHEVVDMQENPKVEKELKEAMLSPSKAMAEKVIKKHGAPKELLTYYGFSPKLWRVLRSAVMMPRVERELRRTTKASQIRTKEQLELVTAMTLIRMQYHWLKIPADAEQLNNLRNIKAQIEAIK